MGIVSGSKWLYSDDETVVLNGLIGDCGPPVIGYRLCYSDSLRQCVLGLRKQGISY